MVNVWIETITDRTYGDVQAVMYEPMLENAKGVYNYNDLNRIENDTAYVLEYMLEHKIIRSSPSLRIKTDWTENDIVVASEMRRIVENIARLCDLSNPVIKDKLPNLYLATQVNYILANQIEEALEIMHTQPELPITYFELEIENGIITSVERLDGTVTSIGTSKTYIAEDEIAHILGVPYGEDAQYQVFTRWSGDTDDLQYVGNVTDMNTTFIGQYHDVKLTANFKTKIPRTLTLTNAYISLNGDDKAESGPRSGVYYAGDNILIIADRAESGKAFYAWEGTQEALDAISVADTDPSTVWLTMPDKNVELHPKYINAGQHYVQVTNGSGSGWYSYDEYVSIGANVPDHYGFDNWSGNTAYLEDIYSSYQSFKMPDINLSFRANYSYRYSYNDITIINGLINGQTTVSGARESSTLTLTPTPPDNTQGLDKWTIEGPGSVYGNTFTVGDGNSIITGHYKPLQTLSVVNKNNNGDTQTYSIVQGHTQHISTQSLVGNYRFDGWYENGTKLSGDTSYTVTMSTSNRTIEARYTYMDSYTVTVINKNNGGQTQTYSIVSGEHFNIHTASETSDYLLEGIYKNGTKVTSSSSYGLYVYSDTTLECKYREKQNYTLTVVNGSGSGTYKERTSVQIVAQSPAEGASFVNWSVTSGSLYSSGSNTSSTTTVIIGSSDATIQANYKDLRDITVITYSGTNTYKVVQGNSKYIQANPAPDTWEFDKWEITSGDATLSNYLQANTYVYAGSQNSTITAKYKEIPYFDVEVENGYVQNTNGEWVTKATFLRNSNPVIQMKPAPEGYQFLQWEIVEGNYDDIYQPLAETTSIRNLLRNTKVRATYYIPDPEVKYTLTITQKDGSIETYNNAAGYQQSVYAQSPDEGYRFYRWNGDYQYLVGGRYQSDNVVNTPARNITLQPTYVREDYVTKYHIYMYSAECLVSTSKDEETGEITEYWSTDGEFEEGTNVRIRPTNIPFGWRFDGWKGATDQETSIIHDLTDTDTYVTVNDFDVHITATIAENEKYTLQITDGQTSGRYYEDYKADIYFSKKDTDDVHYVFDRWTGPGLVYLKLYDGGVFDIFYGGTKDAPQYVRMPATKVEIAAQYTSKYHLTITGGSIVGTQEEYFASGTTVNIEANTPETGKVFVRWDGDTDIITNIYDSSTTVTTVEGASNIVAVYANESDRNNIGYGLTSLINNNTINIEDITIISGEINTGFIVSDTLGHLYIITSINGNSATITRLTKTLKGGNVYE